MLTEKQRQLWAEFQALKATLFNNGSFAILDDESPEVKRYDQLLGYFYPQCRNDVWQSPE